MGEASYSGGDEAPGQVPVVSFFLSALLEMRRHGRGKSGMKGQHVEVGLVVIAGCYFFFCAHTTYALGQSAAYIFWFGYCGSKRMGLGCMDMDMGWLDGEGAVGVWMGWEDGMGKGKGREGGVLYGLSLLTHSLTRSVYLLIIVGSLDNTYMEFIPCHVDLWMYTRFL